MHVDIIRCKKLTQFLFCAIFVVCKKRKKQRSIDSLVLTAAANQLSPIMLLIVHPSYSCNDKVQIGFAGGQNSVVDSQ